MADRREFLKGSLVAASLVVLGKTATSQASTPPYAGIIYSDKSPGKWGRKVGSHLPSITVADGKVTIETKHPMSEEHYIVRHTVVLEDGTVIGEKTFYPTDEKPISEFALPNDFSGKIYATSFCNEHDFWVNEAMI